MARDWTRTYVQQRVALDIRKFQGGRDGRVNLFKPGNEFVWHAPSHGRVAWIRVESDWAEIRYQTESGEKQVTREMVVSFSTTKCNLGGSRAWWLCPNCSERIAVLYGWGVFRCRKCCDLHYQCQSETDADRTLRRAGKLRKRLGWEPGIINPRGGRPRGMHWKTYLQLRDKCQIEEVKAIGDLDAYLGRFRGGPIAMSDRKYPIAAKKPAQAKESEVPRGRKAAVNLTKLNNSNDDSHVSTPVQCRECSNISAGFRCLVPDSGHTYPAMGEWRHCSSYEPLCDR
jgi:hypothetical protein